MDQKICMITGANSGIGEAAAVQIAQQGYHTIMACRSPERGEAALREVKAESGSDNLELLIVDMALQASIRSLAEVFLAKYDRLDALIHNAAIFDITQKEASYTEEGIESVWATNHLGPVLLTEVLWEALVNSDQGRVITIASKGLIAKPFLKVDLADPEYRSKPFNLENQYYQSKLAQIMYTFWLAERGKEAGIAANCIRVPAVRGDIDKYAGLSDLMKKAYAFKSKFALSPEEMAVGYTTLATADEARDLTGLYLDEKVKPVKAPKYARQRQNIEKVMDLTMGYLR